MERHLQSVPDASRWGTGKMDRFSAELFDLMIRYFCVEHGHCLKSLIEDFERGVINHALEETHWNQRRAAQILGVKYTTLNSKVIKLGLHNHHEPFPRWTMSPTGNDRKSFNS